MILQLANINPLLPQRVAAAADFLSPLFAPVLNVTCSHVACGRGTCEASTNDTLGFICKCSSGWSQYFVQDELRFLPCVIPNCNINYSCSKISTAPAPSPSPPSANFSIFDPCLWAYCGGGKCVNASYFDYKCECDEGYYNLFNSTSYPCYRECSLGASCSDLGISMTNSSYSSPPAPEQANAGVLTNFDVFDFLRARGATSDPMGCLGAVAPSECKVFEYLHQSPACTQTRESIDEFLERCEKFKLSPAEKLNIIT
uniref:EGF-like domain-containing protein n=1 Tax=Ananas comosus var. bracteatus TaxID=296719 RepID=A0A6V7NV80_ANACO|nr:unnamed protein product [Ananas comosus var. bracteatus]